MKPVINAKIINQKQDKTTPTIELAVDGGITIAKASKTAIGGVLQANPIKDPSFTNLDVIQPEATLDDVIEALNTVIDNCDNLHTSMDRLLANLRGSGVIDRDSQ